MALKFSNDGNQKKACKTALMYFDTQRKVDQV